jgi:hypothetical protein
MPPGTQGGAGIQASSEQAAPWPAIRIVGILRKSSLRTLRDKVLIDVNKQELVFPESEVFKTMFIT